MTMRCNKSFRKYYHLWNFRIKNQILCNIYRFDHYISKICMNFGFLQIGESLTDWLENYFFTMLLFCKFFNDAWVWDFQILFFHCKYLWRVAGQQITHQVCLKILNIFSKENKYFSFIFLTFSYIFIQCSPSRGGYYSIIMASTIEPP